MTTRPLLIWQLTRRGFCSELNMLLSAYLYSLSRGFDFAISSQKWNGLYKHGWRDYFEPCFREMSSPALNMSFLFMPDTFRNRLLRSTRKLRLSLGEKRPVLLNHDVWSRIWCRPFADARYRIPEKGIEGDCFTACRLLLPSLWRLNAETREAVARLSQPFDPGRAPFFVLQVRRGDKSAEAPPVDLRDYLEKTRTVNVHGLERCLVMTDDYTVVEELRRERPDWRIFTLCPPSERGHLQAAFNSLSPEARRDRLLRLLTELTLARDCAFFVGSFSSSIARFLALLRGLPGMHSVDIPFSMSPPNCRLNRPPPPGMLRSISRP